VSKHKRRQPSVDDLRAFADYIYTALLQSGEAPSPAIVTYLRPWVAESIEADASITARLDHVSPEPIYRVCADVVHPPVPSGSLAERMAAYMKEEVDIADDLIGHPHN
jgi:hypothetical protein